MSTTQRVLDLGQMEVSLEDEVWGSVVTSAVFFLCEENELTEILRED